MYLLKKSKTELQAGTICKMLFSYLAISRF